VISQKMIQFDQDHIWHPYTSMTDPLKVYPVESAHGTTILLSDGRSLIDGMSSWWSTIHGYNNQRLNDAIKIQSEQMNHIMFGGLTHEPAIKLAQMLVEITPEPLQHVFLADSGSIAVEVAMKMALQYQFSKKKFKKCRFGALRKGYHGDTFGAMSVSDPETGMHSLFGNSVVKQLFLNRPESLFGKQLQESDKINLNNFFEQNSSELAAIIVEPIVQGAGGMHFYSAEYLRELRKLCSLHNVLLIADEIATGFGRTGKLFACEHANITPDIICLGKALTGGQMTLAATITTTEVAFQICSDDNVLMHGPTFMANPLACSVALESTTMLLESPWQERVFAIEQILKKELEKARDMPGISDVRILGAIGVIETISPVNLKLLQPLFVDAGIWVRPFGKLVYVMPAYIIEEENLKFLCRKMIEVLLDYHLKC